MRIHRSSIGPVLLAAVLTAAVLAGRGDTSSATAAGPTKVGIGARGQNVIEFTGTINQNGTSLQLLGYLSYVRGLTVSDLFTDPESTTEATALLTFAGTASIAQRTLHGDAINVVALGDIQVFRRNAPGANFSNPASFSEGTSVASYAGRWQNTIATLTPGTPGPTDPEAVTDGVGDFQQTAVNTFTAGRPLRIGSKGLRVRFSFSGWGELLDAQAPKSHIDVAGFAVLP